MLGLALLKDESLCDGAIMYSAFINAHPQFVFSKWVRDAFSIGTPFPYTAKYCFYQLCMQLI